MADVLHRTTKELRRSVHSPDYDTADWIINPDLGPVSGVAVAYWKIDAHNLMHFLRLRVDTHAQGEIRAFATTIAEIFKIWCPLTYEAFEDYRLNTVTFHKHELDWLRGKLSIGGAGVFDAIFLIGIAAALLAGL